MGAIKSKKNFLQFVSYSQKKHNHLWVHSCTIPIQIESQVWSGDFSSWPWGAAGTSAAIHPLTSTPCSTVSPKDWEIMIIWNVERFQHRSAHYLCGFETENILAQITICFYMPLFRIHRTGGGGEGWLIILRGWRCGGYVSGVGGVWFSSRAWVDVRNLGPEG